MWRIPRYWFTFRMPVRRFEYVVSGLVLVAFKFATDSLLYRWGTGKRWSWTGYLHSSYILRFGDGAEATPPWVIWSLALWTLPFLWIGASMTVRRCLDARLSPKWSVLFFVPGINYVLMGVLSLLPSRGIASPPRDSWTGQIYDDSASIGDWLAATGLGAFVGLVMLVVSLWAIDSYGLALFVGAPFVMGAVSAYRLSRSGESRLRAHFAATQIMLLIAGLAIVMFAIEGMVCLIMAYPLATALAFLGALLGRAVAQISPPGAQSMASLVLGLPLLLVGDGAQQAPPLREVVTTVEVDAPPTAVWARVIEFPPLASARELPFRFGIAEPRGARIIGHGVGAIRYCKFSTGEFVEPITVWDAPRRLAFDVASQPVPMRELSPYEEVYAAHLLDGLISKRGEFQLEPLPGERTRLTGRTWYTVDMWPQAYWALWSDAIIHRIHRRVLEHVQRLADQDVRR
jgi:uncharacterized membrane protein YhaH (DUF805 family)